MRHTACPGRQTTSSGRRPAWPVMVFVVCVLLTGPHTIWAQAAAPYVGQVVSEVVLFAEGQRLRDPSVVDLVETRVAEPLSMRQVRESLTHLFALGRFEDVQLSAMQRGDGVVLRYDLVPFAIVERMIFDGDTGVSEDELLEAIERTHGPTFGVEQTEAIADTLLQYYRTRGFMNARVATSDEGDGAERTLRVTVQAGERARINQIAVRGVATSLYRLTLNRLGLTQGQRYDGTDIARRLSDYETELRQLRYYEVETSHSVDILEGGDTANLQVDIQRGPRITVEFAGDEIPDANPTDLVPVAREVAVDEDLLEDADRRIASTLNGLGYRDARVSHTRESDGDELSIIFTVDRGPLYEIAEVVFTGNVAVPLATLTELAGLSPGNPLITQELETALDNVAEHYLRLGYATVRVEPVISEVSTAGAVAGGTAQVILKLEITEGAQMRVRSVTVEGSHADRRERMRAAINSDVGDPYYVPRVVSDRDAIRVGYLNDGFERAVVAVEPEFDEELDAVDLVYRVNEGIQIIIEHVLIVGNDSIGSVAIRQEITLEEGEPLSLVDVAETRRRLNALGLFRQIDIREFSHGGRGLRDVVIIVDEAPATRLSYGGGLEASVRLRRETTAESSQAVERLEFAPRGFFQIGRGNLWGKNRSIDLFTRVSLRRKNDPADPIAAEEANSLGFNEYRVLGTYQEPRVLDTEWDGSITGFVEQAIRPGFDLFSRGLNAQIRRQLNPDLAVSVDYGLGQNNTTNKELNPEDEPLVDRLFPQVRLSAFSGSIVLDRRDDPADPRNGELYTVDVKLAARAIGSEVGFLKTYVGAFMYREIPAALRLVFAGGARMGLASAFVRSVTVMPVLPQDPDFGGVPASPIELDVGELPLSERFFAGGDTSVRGFALDRLGDEATIDQDGFPQGGNATLIFNAELRASVTRAVEIVGFLDAGNVYDRVSSMSLARIRGGAGFGVRYRSPVGPIRVDLGFKLDRQEFGNGELERPTALHISIGQAF